VRNDRSGRAFVFRRARFFTHNERRFEDATDGAWRFARGLTRKRESESGDGEADGDFEQELRIVERTAVSDTWWRQRSRGSSRADGGRRRAAGFALPLTEWTWRSWLTCFLSSLAAGALMSSAAARAIIWSPRTVAAPGITNAAGPRGAGPATREEWRAGAALATNASFAPAARPTARRRAGSERATGLTPARMMDAMDVRCAGRGPNRHRQSRAVV